MEGTLKDKNANDDSEVEVHLEDSKLISDGLQGDRNAFEILFSRYRPILYRLAQCILRNHEESEDAVQNCSLVAFRKMESFKYEERFAVGWQGYSSTKQSRFFASENESIPPNT
jgi:Sigma-70 region 2